MKASKKDNHVDKSDYDLKDFVLGLSYKFFLVFLFAIFILILPFVFGNTFNFQDLGSMGDTFGGFVNPFIAIVAALLTFLAFYVQYTANLVIQNQFKFQKTAEHFYKMLDIHIANILEFEMTTYRLKDDSVDYSIDNKPFDSFTQAIDSMVLINSIFLNKESTNDKNILGELKKLKIKSTKKKPQIDTVKGRRVFIMMEKDYHFCLYLIKKINNTYLNNRLNNIQICELAYKIFFWGTDSLHIYGSKINKKDVNFISKYLSIIRLNFRNNKGAKYSFKYKSHQGKRNITLRFIPFSGHSSRLAHYFRHLYQTVTFLHKSYEEGLISELEMKANLKTLRAQFMNEEVLLLYYNYLCGFGANWSIKGEHNYPYLTDYELIHNIPLFDTIPDIIEHPEEHFKDFISEMKIANPNYRMFEWS
jgi:hypothetical protein